MISGRLILRVCVDWSIKRERETDGPTGLVPSPLRSFSS